ncbi:hypothetical protein ILUMI_07171 [Ignelater luminosus]|uniref:Uncharacterized protein n=1 Tax=Ignelater luminosus TaxID=2038154 RepID=A0A8K0D4D8_IGNLU|nr:hypothetical protein ILUMI_07171 [Ignelater luminosus]
MSKYRSYGLPQYGVAPFDPFYAKEVPQKMGGPNLNYRLLLKNVYESGWTVSQVTHFRSNLDKNMIQYTQSFPDKRLQGEYEITGNILGSKMKNQGVWNLTLYDFVQTTTLTRKPRQAANGTLIYDTPIKAKVNVQTCKNLKLHISNLLRGRSVLALLSCEHENDPQSDIDPDSEISVSSEGFPHVKEVQVWRQQLRLLHIHEEMTPQEAVTSPRNLNF